MRRINDRVARSEMASVEDRRPFLRGGRVSDCDRGFLVVGAVCADCEDIFEVVARDLDRGCRRDIGRGQRRARMPFRSKMSISFHWCFCKDVYQAPKRNG